MSELRYRETVDFNADNALIDSNIYYKICLSNIDAGTDVQDRPGSKINVKGLHCKIDIEFHKKLTPTRICLLANPIYCRVIILKKYLVPHWNESMGMWFPDLWDTADILNTQDGDLDNLTELAFPRWDNPNVHILYDKLYEFGPYFTHPIECKVVKHLSRHIDIKLKETDTVQYMDQLDVWGNPRYYLFITSTSLPESETDENGDLTNPKLKVTCNNRIFFTCT